MVLTLQQFADRLVRSGLFSAEELAAFQEGLPPDKHPETARDLARELILADRVTRFQAEAVYQGKLKGLVMGEYVVLDRIGAGGMGEVLKARHRRMKRIVALKVLPAKAVKSPESVKRFYREVEAAARLNHPNIVQSYDASEYQGIHYLVMEYVDGQDLAQVVREHGPLSVEEAIDCTIQAARGLEYAHGEGVIHRDIKPGNLLLDRKGTVKILDMGLARIDMAGADEPERLTASEQVMGTCDYMAPEQAEDTHSADHRADIYSLGCTLYRLLTGRPPYTGETHVQVLMAHIQKPIPSLQAARQEVPEAVEAVYQKMLAKRPLDRYQSMGEVIEALEACRAPGGSGTAIRAEEPPSDAALGSFLENLAQGGQATGTKQQAKATKAEETLSSASAPEQETGSRLNEARLGGALARPKLSPEARRKTVRYVSIGGGAALCVVLLGLLVVILNRGGEKKPGGKQEVLEPVAEKREPPRATAPFNDTVAKLRQREWAKHLGVPVETTNSIGMKLVLIPPGEFTMGSPKELIEEELKVHAGDGWYVDQLPGEGPQHRVRIARPFYLGVCEVTQGEYEKVMGTNPSDFSATGKQKDKVGGQDTKRFPVELVSWDDAVEFCRKLSERPEEKAAGRWYRLPSEAQWEYAFRAGSAGRYGFSSGRSGVPREYEERELPDYGWFGDNSGGMAHAVGGKRPSAWGLYDMHGNVWEWCQDWYDKGYYTSSPVDDPGGPPGGSTRVNRGGSWRDTARGCRSALRGNREPGRRGHDLGFRVSRVLADKPNDRATPPGATTTPTVVSGSSTATPASTGKQADSDTKPSPSIGPDGKWKLPPGAPSLAVAPFDATKAKEHQEKWAKHLGVPVEITNSIGMKLVLIPPGEFEMGSPKELIEEELKRSDNEGWYKEHLPGEGPKHRVRLTKAFYLGVTEVTQGEYERVMGSNPSEFSVTGKGKDKVAGQDTKRFPVENVSWDDAVEFCRRLSNLSEEKAARRTYRLPSEAQWEYACRAGSTGRYSFSSGRSGVPKEYEEKELSDYGWFNGNSGGMTHAVGGKRPNAWGLYDMHGNVWEWCQDWYAKDYYAAPPPDDPSGSPVGSRRADRGGGWNHPARNCRSAGRSNREPGLRDYALGFRASQVLADK